MTPLVPLMPLSPIGIGLIGALSNPIPSEPFYMTITSPVEPVFTTVIGGTITSTDNGDGTWTSKSDDVITTASLYNNKDITAAVYKKTDDLNTMYQQHRGNSALVSIEFKDSCDLSKVTSMGVAFRDTLITTLNMANMNLGAVLNFSQLLYNCQELLDVTLPIICGSTATTKIHNIGAICPKVKNVDLGGLTCVSTSISNGMFYGDTLLETIDMSNTDITVKSLENMFINCEALKTVDISMIKLSSDFISILNMVYSCGELTTVKLPTITSTEDVSCYHSFYLCPKLVNIDWNNSSFNTSTMSWMYGASTMVDIDISHIDISNCTSLAPFRICPNLQHVKMPTGNASISYDHFFNACPQLICIDKADTTSAGVVSPNMFNGSTTNLVAPNTTERAALESASGSSYVNASPCL